MTKVRANGATIYRLPRKDPGHCVDGKLGLCCPQYRGFKLACDGAELPRLQHDVDRYWGDRYVSATSPAEQVQVLMEERRQRNAPEDWPTTEPKPGTAKTSRI